MCEIYVKSDPIQYELRTRSIRIHGVVTSIRLENRCWDVLTRIAVRDGMTTNQLICQLSDEIIRQQGTVSNFCSFLRISCMRFLSMVALQSDKDSLLLSQPEALTAGDNTGVNPLHQGMKVNSTVLQIVKKKVSST